MNLKAKLSIRLVLASLFFFASSVAFAAKPEKVQSKSDKLQTKDEFVVPVKAPHESRIWTYTYSPEVIFRVYSRPGFHTHIQLAADEGVIEAPNVGDSVQWRVRGGPRNLYVKPLRDDIETSMTLVTNKRTYQFQLISKANEEATQRISFEYPEVEQEFKLLTEEAAVIQNKEKERLNTQIITPSIEPSDLSFEFDIVGSAPFKPTAAYSDKNFTYLILPNVKDLPAVFLIEENGDLSLINYKVRDNMIVIERVVDRALLKLKDMEVKILKTKSKKLAG